MRKKKHIPHIVVASVIILLIIYNLPIPISRSIRCVEIRLDDAGYCIDRQIFLEGTYDLNLWKPDSFVGMISISGYDKISKYDKIDRLEINTTRGDLLCYRHEDRNKGYDWFQFGIIYTTGFLHERIICIYEDGPYVDTDEALCIVANADNYADALEVANTFFRRDGLT